MKKILITEFMEQDSINLIAKKFDVTYDPKLCENVNTCEQDKFRKNLNFLSNGLQEAFWQKIKLFDYFCKASEICKTHIPSD